MIRGIFPSIGGHIYPSPSAHPKGEQIGVTPFRRCVQCGMVNDTRSTSWSEQGEGISYDSSEEEHTVNSGCSSCGSLFWQGSKPEALPDDTNFPSDEWRNYKRINRRK